MVERWRQQVQKERNPTNRTAAANCVTGQPVLRASKCAREIVFTTVALLQQRNKHRFRAAALNPR